MNGETCLICCGSCELALGLDTEDFCKFACTEKQLARSTLRAKRIAAWLVAAARNKGKSRTRHTKLSLRCTIDGFAKATSGKN
eukprot:1158603-Pelagomonas_calceolata.AAC.9